jgi:hypothetical protein
MRRRQNTLLAGIAALALVAGTGLSFAQQNPTSQPGAGAGPSPSTTGGTVMQHSATQHGAMQNGAMQNGATQHGGSNAGPAAQANPSTTGKQQSTAQQNPGHGANRSAQNVHHGKMQHGRTAQTNEHRTERHTALQEHGRTRMNTAQRRNGNLHGLQANTSIPMQGGSLSDQQRTEIRDRVIDARGAPRVGHVDFDVRVGTVVPRRRLHIVPVPETLVRIEPRWRGYDYFVYEDQVVVVSPRTMRIVAVLPA